jgi:hypothetical protein
MSSLEKELFKKNSLAALGKLPEEDGERLAPTEETSQQEQGEQRQRTKKKKER